jgi:hypothetical protein
MELRKVCIALGWQGGTIHQVKDELVKRVNKIFCESYDGPGRRIDLAIEELRSLGVDASEDGQIMTKEVLQRSLYGRETAGSVSSLVLSL